MEKISIIIPIYNEYLKIYSTNYRIQEWLKIHSIDAEIVYVNDGSTDNTQNTLEDICKQHGNVSVLNLNKNMGKGFAVRQGLIYSKNEIKVVLDCDISVDISELKNIEMESLGKRHIIKGIRTQIIKQSLLRIAVGKIWKTLVWAKTGLYMDTQTPFWVMRCPKYFYESLTIDGFAFDVEILSKAKKQNYRVDFVSVKYYNDPDTRVTIRKTLKMLKELSKIRR